MSVVVPTFNRSVELCRCLDSLIAQTFQEFEVLVCDDGSTDDTCEVVSKYKYFLDITYDYAENFGGPARPRNRGIALARAPYVAFLDSDDWWDSDKLLISLRHLDEGADVVFHDLWNVESSEQMVFNRRVKSDQPTVPVYESLLCCGSSIPNSSVVTRIDLLRRIGGVSEDRDLIAVEDFDTLLRISKLTDKFQRIDKCLGYYWNGGGNISSASAKYIGRISAVYQRHIGDLSKESGMKAQSILNYRMGRVAEIHGDYEGALIYFGKSTNRHLGFRYWVKAVVVIGKIKLKKIFGFG